ncbi:MAG: stage V sporulation protein AB [Lachnospiraceae bacterium]|nr:stage V sporulation protein AB [Lachnospiraceae bacterium]
MGATDWAEMFLGISCGAATAAGVFALISVIGIIPRMAGHTHTGSRIHAYEWAVILGGTAGNVWNLFGKDLTDWWQRAAGRSTAGPMIAEKIIAEKIAAAGGLWNLPVLLEVLIGLAIGAFVGCLAMALAEILQVFPILIRRVRLRVGIMYLAIALAAGKSVGALWYFWNQG